MKPQTRYTKTRDGVSIALADTVRGLCPGTGFLFADRGEFVAKASRSQCGFMK